MRNGIDSSDFADGYWGSWIRWHAFQRYQKGRMNRFRGALLRLRTCLRQLPAGSLVIDCGANVGDVTGIFLQHGMKVIAFEPDPVALEVLRDRFGTHGDVQIVPKAVGGKSGSAPLFQTKALSSGDISETTGSSLIRQKEHNDEPVATVDVVDLVSFIRSLPERVRILKLDIEGYEAEVLESLLDTGLYREIDLVLVETHKNISEQLRGRIIAIRDRLIDQRIANISLDWR